MENCTADIIIENCRLDRGAYKRTCTINSRCFRHGVNALNKNKKTGLELETIHMSKAS